MGGIEKISYYDGATVITNFSEGGSAVTLGNYINGKNELKATPSNSVFQHEYGHYLQSQEMGPAYLSRVGLPSIMSNHNHDYHPIEMDANKRAFKYFNENVPGFYSTEENWRYHQGWDFEGNPLNQKGKYEDYYSYDFSFIHAKWYDYLWIIKGPLGTLLDGLCLGIYYNRQYK